MESYEIEELIDEKIREAVVYNIVVAPEEIDSLSYEIDKLKEENEELRKRLNL